MRKNKTKTEILAELEQAHRRIAELEARHEEKQRFDQDYLNALVDSLDISLCRWLPDTTLTYANAKYKKIFGSRGDIINQSFLISLPEETRPATLAFYEELVEDPRTVTYEYPVLVQDGSIRQYQWIDTPILDAQGRLVEFQSIGLDITERKETEQALRDSEELYRQTLVNISDAVFITDASGAFTFICPNVSTIFGYTQAEVAQMQNINALLGEALFDLGALEKAGEIQNIEHTIKDKYGHEHTLLVNVKSIAIRGGTLLYSCHDISERKRSEEALRKSEALLAEAQRLGKIGHMEWTPSAGAMVCSEELYRIFELPRDGTPITPQSIKALASPEEWERLLALDHQAFANHTNPDYEYRVALPSGRECWVHQRMQVAYDEQGKPQRMLGIVQDITEQKRAKDALRASEERFATMFRFSPNAIALTRLSDNRLLDVNKAWEELTGWPRHEAVGKPVHDLNVWEDLSAREHMQTLLAGGQVLSGFEIQMRARSGAILNLLMSADVVTLQGEACLLTLAQDITERKRAQNAIAEYTARLETAEQVAGFGSWEFDLQTEKRWWSKPMYRLLGFEISDTAPDFEAYLEHIHPQDRRQVHAQLERMTRGLEPLPEEFRTNPRYGSEKYVSTSVRLVRDAQGAPVKYIGSLIDITERKQAEEKLRQSEERFRTVADFAYAMEYWVDENHQLVYMSPSCQRVTGYDREAFLQNPTLLDAIIHPSDRGIYALHLAQEFEDAQSTSYDFRIIAANGELRWINHTCQAVYAHDGRWHGRRVSIRDITERKAFDDKLRQSEELFRVMFQASGVVMVMVDPASGQIVEANPAAVEFYGYPLAQLTCMNIEQINQLPPEQVKAARLKALNKRQDHFIFPHRLANGDIRTVEVYSHPFNAPDRSLLLSIIIDITERVQAEAALHASEEKYRGLLASLDTSIATIDGEGRCLYMNDVAANSLGGTPAELIGKNIYELFPQEYADSAMAAVREVIGADRSKVVEMQGLIRDQLRWYRVFFQPIHDESGKVSHALVNITDIDDLKRNQQELELLNHTLEQRVKERTAQVQDLYDNAPVGYHSLDANGQFIAVNQTELDWLGYTREELLGKPVMFIYAPHCTHIFNEYFPRLKAEGKVQDIAFDAQRKDGTIFPALMSAIAVYDAQGNFVSSRSTLMDITERKRAEQALRENEERMELAFRATQDGIWDWNVETGTEFHSSRWKAMLGYADDEIEQTFGAWQRLIHPDDLPRVMQVVGSVMDETGVYVLEFRMRHKDGHYVDILSRGTPVRRDADGAIVRIVGTHFDLTERKHNEELLRLTNAELERALRIKDEFLANMSHELRTPLNAIIGISESLSEQIMGELNPRQLKYVNTIGESGHHLLNLINDILDLSKIEAGNMVLERNKVDVATVCRASLNMIKQMAQKKGVAVEFEIDPAIDLIVADERRLKQMLVNLLTNAVKFTPSNGQIGLVVRGDLLRHKILFIVWDTGIGIKPEDQARLFKPFVQVDASLDRAAGGTGLGLALVAQMARLHAGSVGLESVYGEGSRFTITLPWEEAGSETLAPASAASQEAPAGPTPPRRTILLVEDTETTIMILQDYLEAAGYSVFIARNGQDGIRMADQLKPDLILMDVQMPVLNGLDATRMLRQKPALQRTPIIALTALAMPNDRERCLAAGMTDYLSKPVNLKHLASMLESYLAQEKP